MREAFAKASKKFQQKILAFFLDINVRKFNETLTKHVVSFEQPAVDTQLNRVNKKTVPTACVYSVPLLRGLPLGK